MMPVMRKETIFGVRHLLFLAGREQMARHFQFIADDEGSLWYGNLTPINRSF